VPPPDGDAQGPLFAPVPVPSAHEFEAAHQPQVPIPVQSLQLLATQVPPSPPVIIPVSVLDTTSFVLVPISVVPPVSLIPPLSAVPVSAVPPPPQPITKLAAKPKAAKV
jgi:hypothetical protein